MQNYLKIVFLLFIFVFSMSMVGCGCQELQKVSEQVVVEPPVKAKREACMSNLRSIDTAIQAYYSENEKYPTSVSELVPQYLASEPNEPFCGKSYTIDYITHKAVCPATKENDAEAPHHY